MSKSTKKNEELLLEQYLGKIKNLSTELEQNFSTLCKLDSNEKELINDVDTLTDNFFANAGKMAKQERKEAIGKINTKYHKADKCAGEKMKLSKEIYEAVDKIIIKMDADIAKYEAGSLQYQLALRQYGLGPSKASESYTQGSKKTSAKDYKTASKFGYAIASSSSALPTVDMPVDPNEPTYCLCDQVSYGDMIACDNPQCVIEWFHFGCVNVTKKPKGKWYCPQCRLQMKKK